MHLLCDIDHLGLEKAEFEHSRGSIVDNAGHDPSVSRLNGQSKGTGRKDS